MSNGKSRMHHVGRRPVVSDSSTLREGSRSAGNRIASWIRRAAFAVLCAFVTLLQPATAPAVFADTCADADGDGYFASADNLSKSPGNSYRTVALNDSEGNPVVAWYDGSFGYCVTRWNGENWTKMDRLTPGFDVVTSHYAVIMALDSRGNPFFLIGSIQGPDGPSAVSFTRWDGRQWSTMSGAPGIEAIGLNVSEPVWPTSIALDAGDRPYLVWVDRMLKSGGGLVEDVFLTRWDGTKWATMSGASGAENLTDGHLPGGGGSILIDSTGKPFVLAWQTVDLYLTHWNGTAWTGLASPTSRFDHIGRNLNGHHTWQLDSSDRPYIAWSSYPYRLTNPPDDILFTHWDGTKWAKMSGAPGSETLAVTTDYSIAPQMVLDAAGRPYVVWQENEEGKLGNVLFTRWNGSSWSGMNGAGSYENMTAGTQKHTKSPHIALDSAGRPNLVWLNDAGTGGLWRYLPWFTRWEGSKWARMNGTAGYDRLTNGTPPSGSLAFDPALILLDRLDRPSVIYGDWTYGSGDIMAKYWDGTAWTRRYEGCGLPVDCDDYKPLVHPTGVEVCTDGVDNNCNGLIDKLDPACTLPTAAGGEDQTVHTGSLATLDGSASTDPGNAYPLTYAWQVVSSPDGSHVALQNPDAVDPSFVAGLPGDYVIELRVTNALNATSQPDQVKVSTFNSAPTSEAGPAQSILEVGTVVSLDGTKSYDIDGDQLTYLWSPVAKPSGSAAVLSDVTAPAPVFTADVHGDYVFQLAVSDAWTSGEPDTVVVSFDNIRPVADAGGNQSVVQGETVVLNGSQSRDLNLDPLVYLWSMVSQPAGSVAVIAGAESAQATFVADLPGQYVVSLAVDDGFEKSEPSNAVIVAVSYQDHLVLTLQRLIDAINALPDDAFKNPNNRHALTNKVNEVLKMVDNGLYDSALNKLENDIQAKMDGCSTGGAADANDMITDCAAQGETFPLAAEAVELLVNLID